MDGANALLSLEKEIDLNGLKSFFRKSWYGLKLFKDIS